MNRQQRRKEERQAKKLTPYEQDIKATVTKCIQSGIEAEKKVSFAEGYRAGVEFAYKVCYAAMCLTLKQDFHFGKDRLTRALTDTDNFVCTAFDSEDAIDKVFEECGILLDFKSSFAEDRVQEV